MRRFKFLKFVVVIACLLGFIYQTMSFMFYFWTYPVVLDIQTVAPDNFLMPAITFCNGNGIKPWELCRKIRCIPGFIINSADMCQKIPRVCEIIDVKIPKDLKILFYGDLMRRNNMTPDELQNLKKPVDDFFSCKIISSFGERNCTNDGPLIGSYYSVSDIFGICYTINSLWSQPSKTLERLTRADKIKIEFYTNMIDRGKDPPMDEAVLPKYIYPTMSTAIQLLLHNNFVSLSRNAYELLGGKSYQLKLKQEEKHLLPAPYSTNCTDYLSEWKNRGGIGPLNPMMLIEECKYNRSLIEFGCVPYSIDYPHNDTVCKLDIDHIEKECENLLKSYNQPCDFTSYKITLEEKIVLIEKRIGPRNKSSVNSSEVFFSPQKGYYCVNKAVMTRRCQTVQVEILFDDFQITTSTYEPKFVSNEILSVIGSYMGIYLGISMFSISELFEALINRFMKKKNKGRIRIQKNKNQVIGNTNHVYGNGEFHRRNRVGNFNTREEM